MDEGEVGERPRRARGDGLRIAQDLPVVRAAPQVELEALLEPAVVAPGLGRRKDRVTSTELERVAPLRHHADGVQPPLDSPPATSA